MKIAAFLILIGTLTVLVAVWVNNDGPARALDSLWKQGFDESGIEKVRIHEQFRGTWKLAFQIDEAGRRKPVNAEPYYFLSISEGKLSKWRVNEPKHSLVEASGIIMDNGTVWTWERSSAKREHVATLRIVGDELHVVFRDEAPEVYVPVDPLH